MNNSHAMARLIAESAEANRILNFLASMPGGVTATTTRVARKVLLDTSGQLLAHGDLYNIKVKSLGCGVQQITLVRRNA